MPPREESLRSILEDPAHESPRPEEQVGFEQSEEDRMDQCNTERTVQEMGVCFRQESCANKAKALQSRETLFAGKSSVNGDNDERIVLTCVKEDKKRYSCRATMLHERRSCIAKRSSLQSDCGGLMSRRQRRKDTGKMLREEAARRLFNSSRDI